MNEHAEMNLDSARPRTRKWHLLPAGAALIVLLAASGAGAANVDVNWVFGMVQPDLVVNVGDTVTFNFVSGHTVDEFTSQANYDACDFTGSTTLATTGPYVHTFTSAGTFHFGCTVGAHCAAGSMKVQVTAITTSVPGANPWILTGTLALAGALCAGWGLRRRSTESVSSG